MVARFQWTRERFVVPGRRASRPDRHRRVFSQTLADFASYTPEILQGRPQVANCPGCGRFRPHPGIPARSIIESSISVEPLGVSRTEIDDSAIPLPSAPTRDHMRAIRANALGPTDQIPNDAGYSSPRDPRSCVLPWSVWCGSRVEDPEGTPKAPLTHTTPTSTLTQRSPRTNTDVAAPAQPHRRLTPRATTPTSNPSRNHTDVAASVEPHRHLPSRNHADVYPRGTTSTSTPRAPTPTSTPRSTTLTF
jgi:hypothetical protein